VQYLVLQHITLGYSACLLCFQATCSTVTDNCNLCVFNLVSCVCVLSEKSSAVDDEQQSTVKLLADARRMAYVKGRWVYTDTGCEQLYQIVSPTLPGNGDYSLASTIMILLFHLLVFIIQIH